MDFQVFHRYAALARRGFVEPVTCRHCNNELQHVLGAFDEPVLRCYTCNSTVIPGLALYSRMQAAVKEHN